jgi:four helix bundle protein
MTYQITNSGNLSCDFGLRGQMRHACVSMANIAQGFGRRSDKEFVSYLDIAPGAACEAQSHPYVALDLGYLPQDYFDRLYSERDEVGKKTHALAQHRRSESAREPQ